MIFSKFADIMYKAKRSVIIALALVTAGAVFLPYIGAAQNETRSLKLYYIHTKEKAEIVFKRNGKYDQAGLKKLNVFLRDWRRNEPTNMDPRLFDLIWTVYRNSGSHEYINVVSAYRSPATNNMLRSRSANSGVAKNSQHTLGHAMDFFLPDIKLAKLRAIGLKQQVGGVGYYPKSGSPFVHMDIGNVRHWPRMSRKELLALFPDGKTMHIPTDGKPLAGYAQAKAEWLARRGAPVLVASAAPSSASHEKKSLFGSIFGKGDKTERAPGPQRDLTPAPTVREELPGVEVASLPTDDIPVPEPSPLRAAPQGEEDDGGDDSALMAYADVPIPVARPNDLVFSDDAPAADSEQSVAAAVVPLPSDSPAVQAAQDQIAMAIAGYDDDAAAGKQGSDDLASLIDDNNDLAVIPVPDDDWEDEDDYIDLPDDNGNGVASADNGDVADNQQVASIAPVKVAPKADKPTQDDVSTIIHEKTSPVKELSVDEELKRVPNMVFVLGLNKENNGPKLAVLRGKAIDFRTVAKINATY